MYSSRWATRLVSGWLQTCAQGHPRLRRFHTERWSQGRPSSSTCSCLRMLVWFRMKDAEEKYSTALIRVDWKTPKRTSTRSLLAGTVPSTGCGTWWRKSPHPRPTAHDVARIVATRRVESCKQVSARSEDWSNWKRAPAVHHYLRTHRRELWPTRNDANDYRLSSSAWPRSAGQFSMTSIWLDFLS